MIVQRFEQEKEAYHKAKQCLDALLLQERGRPILLMASGGSALRLLETLPEEMFSPLLTLTVLDERHSVDDDINTFAHLAALDWYPKALEQGMEVIDTRTKEWEKVDEAAARWEGSLRVWKEEHPHGVVIATQGFGADGHTAGIFPGVMSDPEFQERFDDPSRWVVGYDAGDVSEYALRMTVTFPFLRDIVDHSVMVGGGNAKKEAMRRITDTKHGSLAYTPARIAFEMKDTRLFVSA